MIPPMDTAIQDTLFPMPEAAAMPEPKTVAERVRLWAEAGEGRGGLLPQSMLADVLGVTRQRVFQFVQEGRFETVMLFGQRFITGDSLGEFISQERKSGHHFKQPSTLKLVAASYRMGKTVTGQE